MTRQRRFTLFAVAAALVAVAAAHHPSANIRILTHDRSDPAPHRMLAAVDLGIAAVSILITWTGSEIGT